MPKADLSLDGDELVLTFGGRLNVPDFAQKLTLLDNDMLDTLMRMLSEMSLNTEVMGKCVLKEQLRRSVMPPTTKREM